MKNLSLLFALFLSVVATAQDKKSVEIFPNNHPELLLGKTVKILPLPEKSRAEGYSNFATNVYGTDTYHKIGFKKSAAESLENRVFKVVPNELNKLNVIKLESPEGEIIYHAYNKYDDREYYFEVEGGLDIPEDFYCEYFQPGVDDGKKINRMSKNFWGTRVWVNNNLKTDKLEINMMFNISTKATKGITIIFDNGEKLEDPNAQLSGKYNDGSLENKDYVYMITTEREKKLFSENLITTVIFGKEKSPVDSDFPARHSEKIRGIVECGYKTIEERNKL
ncbi:hypothetical protein FUA48_11100 [Flavobacterium alkalisoli]|uniref:Uncharacterized protein n=1 Tax=Flavobacterium alkalisoli TaxID=2602769 RepID=A0A5B9FVL9_9FLAO|nr:hypothetical protein [Flavobacterium alkalisoli]QEE50106.1 hypothetical protein FUA48_11100 [Flavobacterium alkalisoli]